MIVARGSRPRASAFSRAMMSRAAPPSLRLGALPAVTVPSGEKTGLRAASFSREVSGRGCSSLSKTTGAPFLCGTSTGTISWARRPAFWASRARMWLR
jgi:hypothetical protein